MRDRNNDFDILMKFVDIFEELKILSPTEEVDVLFENLWCYWRK